MSESYRVIDRIKQRFGEEVADAFDRLLNSAREAVDLAALESTIASGASVASIIQSVLSTSDVARIVGRDQALLQTLTNVTRASGQASMRVVEDGLGVALGFDYTDPLAVEAAREQIGLLITQLTREQLQAIRNAIELGQSAGLTVVQQARLIREAVGLPATWANAPANLADELRRGDANALTRRLPANVLQEIRSRLEGGIEDEAFIARVVEIYTRSLINRRAQNISRTETATAAHEGQQRAWEEAKGQGLLPETVRRYWIVTPDERLRRSHAEIVVMNPQGVDLGEPFETPFGPVMHPPAEPNCRCSVGLLLEGGSIL